MKPNWKDAPDWAQYFAQDKSGDCYWYELEPEIKGYYWNNNLGGKVKLIYNPVDWIKSLEKRPEE